MTPPRYASVRRSNCCPSRCCPPTQLLSSGLQFLRQPFPSDSAGHCLGDALGMGQHLTEVVPDKIVELVGSTEARGALLLLATVDGLGLSGTDVVVVATLEMTGGA